nr:putative ribonuclease H-like domain-containing protein [Tanacetum cinerariifolium]
MISLSRVYALTVYSLITEERIFRYLKGHLKVGLWYPKESPFDLVAHSDSDYGGATQDRKSTTRGCQFLGRRLISWQCKKQTIVATSTTEAEYVAAASGCGQVLWIQNQMLDHGPTVYVSHIRQFWSTARIETTNEETKILATVDDEPASLLRDDSQGEAFLTISSLDAGQHREKINKTSALPYESSSKVTSLDADEGTQDLEISGLKARVKFLKDKDRGSAEPTQEDAPIKGGIMEIEEEVGVERSIEQGSNDTEEMVNVLSSMEAANILTSEVIAVSVSPVAGVSTVGVPTVSGLFPTVNAIFTTASVRLSEQLARDSKIARLHAEEDLKMMIEGLDRSNEVIAKHLQEYEQAAADLSIGEKIELINELVKYQDYHAKILKYQAHQSKPLSKKEGMTLEEIKEKFIPVWKQLEDFVTMSSKEEGERIKRKGLKLDQWSAKRIKTSEDVSEEDFKGMMQLVPLEEVYVEALLFDREDLHQLRILVKKTLSIKQATKDKEKELWVELKRLFEPDFEDQLWTHNQAFIHDPLEWKLYDTCGVHHVFTKDQEIFMLVEKDYPLRKGLATVMICNKLQVKQYSQIANDLILKIHNIANSPR